MPSTLGGRPGRENVRTSELCSSVERACKLGSRADPELRVDVRQMAGDGSLAEEERGGDLSVRPALCDQSRDALLGRGQAVLATAAADRSELGPRTIDPRRRAELFEPGQRPGDRVACRALLQRAPAGDAQREQGAG